MKSSIHDFTDISSVFDKVFNEFNLFLKFSIHKEISDFSIIADTPDLIYDPIIQILEYSSLLAEKKVIDAQVSSVRKKNKSLIPKSQETDENDLNSLTIQIADAESIIEQLTNETDSLRSENQQLYSIPRLNRLLIPTTGRTKLINKLDQIKKIKSSILQIENEIGYQKYHSEHDIAVFTNNISLLESDIDQLFAQISKTEDRCMIFHFPCTLEINNSLGVSRPKTSFVQKKEITPSSYKSAKRIKSKTSLSTAVNSSRRKKTQHKTEMQSDNHDEKILRMPQRTHNISKPGINSIEISASTSSSISARIRKPKIPHFDDDAYEDHSFQDVQNYNKGGADNSYNDLIRPNPGSTLGNRVKSNDYFAVSDEYRKELTDDISLSKAHPISDKSNPMNIKDENQYLNDSHSQDQHNEHQFKDFNPNSQISSIQRHEEEKLIQKLDPVERSNQIQQEQKKSDDFSPRINDENQTNEETPLPKVNQELNESPFPQLDSSTISKEIHSDFSPRPNTSDQTNQQEASESPFPKLNPSHATEEKQLQDKSFLDFSPRPNQSNNIKTNGSEEPKSEEVIAETTNETFPKLQNMPKTEIEPVAAEFAFPQFNPQSADSKDEKPFTNSQIPEPNSFSVESNIAEAYSRIAIRGAIAQIRKVDILKDERNSDHIIV